VYAFKKGKCTIKYQNPPLKLGEKTTVLNQNRLLSISRNSKQFDVDRLADGVSLLVFQAAWASPLYYIAPSKLWR
jgi:hypothetical protein